MNKSIRNENKTLKFRNFFYVGALLVPLLSAKVATAQGFDKFESKTKFNKRGSSKSAADLVKKKAPVINLRDKPANETDAFGRSSSVGQVREVSKESAAYVNLNPETAFGPEVVKNFNFDGVELEELTKQMQKLTGIKLILDGKGLKGKITILSPTAITVGDAWKSYLTALEINGYTLVPSGKFYKIVSTRDIRYTPTKIYTGNYTPDTDNYVMRILPLKNIDSTEVTRSFRPFMTRFGRIIDIKQTNTIIVQDTGSNINRLVRLIKFIDVPGYEESLQIIPVKNSSAPEIAKLLDQILKSNSSGSSKFKSAKTQQAESISKIIAEQRTNSIIAMANAQGAKQLRELIKKLDVSQVSQGGGRIHVYYINHGDAEELAKTLSSLVSGAQQNSSRSSRTSRLRSRLSTSQDTGSQLFSDDVKITADKDNNALVVTASPTDYLTLKEVISKLDVPRDQVYVEGLIMETNVDNSRSLGVSIVSATGSGAAQRVTSGPTGDFTSLVTGTIPSLGGLFAGVGLGSKVELNANGQTIEVNSVNALIKAIASNTNNNVLATPQVLALDNTESVFEVGETVPITENLSTPTGTQTSVKNQKVALTLKITPQINKVSRFIKLKIDQQIDDFAGSAQTSGSNGVATTTRSINTTVVVRDRDTVAMGGLMRDKDNYSTSKVPLLGDIPVLGWLFKSTEKSVVKTNLLFFMTPRILANYQADNAANVKDLLNRRSHHLKNAVGDEDPFGTTVKGIYEKVKKQENGPLYKDNRNYDDINNDADGIGGKPLPDDMAMTPDYTEIAQEIKMKQSATKKEN